MESEDAFDRQKIVELNLVNANKLSLDWRAIVEVLEIYSILIQSYEYN